MGAGVLALSVRPSFTRSVDLSTSYGAAVNGQPRLSPAVPAPAEVRMRWSRWFVIPLGLLIVTPPGFGQTPDTARARTSCAVSVSTDTTIFELTEVTEPPIVRHIVVPRLPPGLVQGRLPARVVLSLVVNADGNVDSSSAAILERSNTALDSEALRIAKAATFWPGCRYDDAVRIRVRLPIQYGGATTDTQSGRQALGQGGSRTIKGTVVDSANHNPVSQAAIYLGRTATGQRTGHDGTFRISAAVGPLVLMVRRWGYVPALVTLPEGIAGTEMDLGATSMRQLKTDPDRAAAQDADVRMYPELARFYDHKARYRQGVFLTPDDLQRVGGSLFSLIRQKPGFHFICYVTRKGERDCGQQASRGRTYIMNPNPTSAEQQPCLLELWTNALGPRRTLDEVQTDDVLAVEAYPDPGATPQEFTGSPCAAIMLWMK